MFVMRAPGTRRYEMELLWENANPGSTFAAQTIELELAAYDLCAVECLYNSSTSKMIMMQFSKIETGKGLYLNCASGNTGTDQSRGVNYVEGGLEINDAYRGGSKNNACMIPYRIFGIKGVEQ